MYILDADILITAKRTYFQFKRVRQFWEWLAYQAENGNVGMPIETWVKIGDKAPNQRDDLAEWVIEHKDNLVIVDRSYDKLFAKVLEQYKWPDGREFTETDLVTVGDDYALVACALHLGWTLVSNEVSEGTIGANRKVPDVCADLGVECIDLDGRNGDFGLLDKLDFSTDWNG